MLNEIEHFKSNLAKSLFIFCDRLNAIITAHEDEDCKFLFIPRAGYTLFRLINEIRAQNGQKLIDKENIIWLNRTVLINTTGDNVDYLNLLEKNIGKNIFRLAEMFQKCFGLAIKDIQLKDTKPEHISALIKYSEKRRKSQRKLLEKYLKSYNSKNLIFVDSGWSGTTETIISDILGTEYSVSRLSIGSNASNPKISSKGILYDNWECLEDNPFVAIKSARHLFEILLEPDFGTQIKLEQEDGNFYPIFDSENQVNDKLRYKFAQNIYHEYISLVSNKKNKIDIIAKDIGSSLASQILYPSKELAESFSEITVSHDMGTSGEIPIIGLKNTTIQDLWPQANYAAYYQKDLVSGYQNKFNQNYFTKKIQHIAKKEVDVITRTMDRPFFLERALKSVASQNYKRINHIIVVDGSPVEPVLEKIEECLDDTYNIKVLHLISNKGMESASNHGIKKGSGAYILIHDDDDTLEPDFISSTCLFLETNQNLYEGVVTACTHVSEQITRDGIQIKNTKEYNPQFREIYLHDILEENTFAPISFLFTRRAFNEVGNFDETLPVLGDWDFNLRFLKLFNIGYIDRRLSNYHHRDIKKDFAFGNTVNTGIDKHAKYQPIVRNKHYRDNEAFAISSHLRFLTNKLMNRITNLENEIKKLKK